MNLLNILKENMTMRGSKPWFKIIFWLVGLGFVAGLVLVALSVMVLSYNLPSVEEIDQRQMSQSTKIYDREGKVVLYEISAGKKRTLAPFEEIPKAVKDATIAVEEQNFYTNPAIDWKGVLRAVYTNLLRGGIVQGGSTITQQLAKNAFLSPEVTYTRKVRELILAVQLSRHYSKDKILWLYLNEVPYGPTIYGVGSASEAYLGKEIKDLNIAESAIIAAIARKPSYYYPWGSHVTELYDRQKFVLKRMRELNKITESEYQEALNTPIKFQPQSTGILAPHFTLSVQDYLVKKYGEDMVRTGGLQVKTTLNYDLQKIAEGVVLEGAKRNEELYKGKNAALVALDPKTGQVLAMVGSRDYFDVANEGNFNVATQGKRQPGSALKPFIYLTAFEAGFLPQTVLFDVPTEFVPNNPACPILPDLTKTDPRCFHPHNYDSSFRGPISLKDALAQSINIPAVKTLYLAGMKNSLKTLSDFGVTTLSDPSRYGLSLVLGGGEVKLIELAGAYGVLAQEGVKHDQSLVLEVKDSTGQVLESYKDHSEQVIDPKYVRMINAVLSDPEARSALFQGSLNLTVFPGYDIALKTGTTNDYKDAWAMGYTPNFVVGVWAGNNNNTSMQRKGGSILAAVPIWSAFLKEALKSVSPEKFSPPENTPEVKPVLAGNYIGENGLHSILYYIDKDDPLGPPPSNPAADPQFNNWETSILDWAVKNSDKLKFVLPINNSFTQEIKIIEPQPGHLIRGGINIQANITGRPLSRVRVWFNGEIVREFTENLVTPYSLNFFLTPGSIKPQNLLEIEAVDQNNSSTKSGVVIY